MKFGISFTDTFKKQVHLILSGYIQILHFYRTLSKGLLFPGHSVEGLDGATCLLHYGIDISLNQQGQRRSLQSYIHTGQSLCLM